ncbi:hypothetical protein CHUAL_012613 [Chamberlinius hualienensis]
MYGIPRRHLTLFMLPLLLCLTSNSADAYFKPAARVFPELLGVQNSCYHNGAQYSCTFVLFCWWGGAQFVNKCGNSWMFTCCIPKGIPMQAPPRHDVIVSNHIKCGIPKMSVSKRIIGGETASFGEFPWLAHIRISGQQCGGVLINNFYVATAAHCVRSARLGQISVILGEHDLQDTGRYFEPLQNDVFGVTEKRIHPNFLYMLTQPDRFDLALLRLNRKVLFRDNILPICLPKHSQVDALGTMAVVAGWGKTDQNVDSRTGTYILQKVYVPIISDEECLKWHEEKGITLLLYPEMMCAGYKEGKKDACLGDSGGPLMAVDDGRWTLIGITSAGFGCALDKQPGIYHKITTTIDWITANSM